MHHLHAFGYQLFEIHQHLDGENKFQFYSALHLESRCDLNKWELS